MRWFCFLSAMLKNGKKKTFRRPKSAISNAARLSKVPDSWHHRLGTRLLSLGNDARTSGVSTIFSPFFGTHNTAFIFSRCYSLSFTCVFLALEVACFFVFFLVIAFRTWASSYMCDSLRRCSLYNPKQILRSPFSQRLLGNAGGLWNKRQDGNS